MSLRFKMLREQKNFTKTKLAKSLGMTFRTITNWEQVEGTIPPLHTVKDIASKIGATTFEVFSCFVYGPDYVDFDEFEFNSHKDDIPKRFTKYSPPQSLFKYINALKLFGEGTVVYKHKIFRYSRLILQLSSIDEESESAYFDLIIEPSKGFILEDENANCLIFTAEIIKDWKIVSSTTNQTSFEITIIDSFFPDMEDDLRTLGGSTIYLNAYKVSVLTELPYFQTAPLVIEYEVKNVIGKYIKLYRELRNMTQQQVAELVENYTGYKLSKQTVNRWERGTLVPSLNLLACLCLLFNISAEKLLDAYEHGYFVSNGIDNVDHYFNIGLNYSFWNSTDFDSLRKFLSFYSFFNDAKYSTSLVSGWCRVGELESGIQSISIKNNAIIITLDNSHVLAFDSSSLISITPRSTHQTAFYDFKVIIMMGVEELNFALYLEYNFPAKLLSNMEKENNQ